MSRAHFQGRLNIACNKECKRAFYDCEGFTGFGYETLSRVRIQTHQVFKLSSRKQFHAGSDGMPSSLRQIGLWGGAPHPSQSLAFQSHQVVPTALEIA